MRKESCLDASGNGKGFPIYVEADKRINADIKKRNADIKQRGKSESIIQNEIRLALSKAGYVNFRINCGKVKKIDGMWFETGAPNGHFDIYGFRPDKKIFYIEVKTEKGKPNDDQVKFHEMLSKHGVIHGIARSVEEALKIVSEGLIGEGF